LFILENSNGNLPAAASPQINDPKSNFNWKNINAPRQIDVTAFTVDDNVLDIRRCLLRKSSTNAEVSRDSGLVHLDNANIVATSFHLKRRNFALWRMT
jgi:hypothetical protein